MTNEIENEDLPALDNGQDYNDLLQDIVEYHIGQTTPVEPEELSGIQNELDRLIKEAKEIINREPHVPNAQWYKHKRDRQIAYASLATFVVLYADRIAVLPPTIDLVRAITDSERAVLEQLLNQGTSIVDFGHPDKVTLVFARHELAPVPRATFSSLRSRIKPLIEHKPGTGWIISDLGRALITTLAVHEAAEPADQVCDVFKFGHCNRCDHPCKDYLENNGYR